MLTDSRTTFQHNDKIGIFVPAPRECASLRGGILDELDAWLLQSSQAARSLWQISAWEKNVALLTSGEKETLYCNFQYPLNPASFDHPWEEGNEKRDFTEQF
uniref:Uncharacterized protein n=1 Tax=Micrurus paraensis TaxID=1970185 RepID=A0A2D4KPY7_9SAUR